MTNCSVFFKFFRIGTPFVLFIRNTVQRKVKADDHDNIKTDYDLLLG